MHKGVSYTLITASILGISGCGGSSSPASSSFVREQLSDYRATSSDGSTVLLGVFSASGGVWEGSFDLIPTDGGYRDENDGEFVGTISGASVHATCQTNAGTTFDLNGTFRDGVYHLVRSDRVGETLVFSAAAVRSAPSRATKSFRYLDQTIRFDSTPVATWGPNFEYAGVMNDTHPVRIFQWTLARQVDVSVGLANKGSCSSNFTNILSADLGSVTMSTTKTTTILENFIIKNGEVRIAPF